MQFVDHIIPSGHACSGATLEPGTGTATLTPLMAGDTVSMVMGPQGGTMLLLAWRARGLDPSKVTLCARLTFPAGGAEIGFDCFEGALTELTHAGVAECVGQIAQTLPMYWGNPDL